MGDALRALRRVENFKRITEEANRQRAEEATQVEVSDWFKIGMPEREPVTNRQKMFLAKSWEQVLDVMTPEERCNTDIMGFEAWLETLDKSEASRIISVLKGGDVAREIKRRSENAPPRRWFDTGLSRPIERTGHAAEEEDHGP